MVDAMGQVEAEQRYKAFGETRYESAISLGTKYQYTGQRNEAGVGLYFYNARWYDAYLNRFIQADTIVANPKNTKDWDRYSYVRNNPVKYIDPSGHCTINGHWMPDSDQACKWASLNQKSLTGIGNGGFHGWTILICGMNGGTCGPNSDLRGYDSGDGYTKIFDYDDCGTKAACAEEVYNFIAEYPGSSMTIIGHSAGADIAILAANRAVEAGLVNVTEVVLLDPTLTSSPNPELGYLDYRREGSQAPLVLNLLSLGVKIFVGVGSGANDSGVQVTPYLNPANPLNVNLAEYQSQGLYRYESYGFTHPEMAKHEEVRTDIFEFLE